MDGTMACHTFRVNGGTALAGHGDSGGAWFFSSVIPPAATASVHAAGIESGTSEDVACQGYPRGATACGYYQLGNRLGLAAKITTR